MNTTKWVEQPRPETHQSAFTSVFNETVGLTIANRGLPEVEVLNTRNHTEIALTLFRAVGWLSRDDMPERQGHAGPGFETPGAQVPGKWEFNYSIIPHKGDWREVLPAGICFSNKLTGNRNGYPPRRNLCAREFYSSSPTEFVISAVKAAENGKGWLVRGFNISSERYPGQLETLPPFY